MRAPVAGWDPKARPRTQGTRTARPWTAWATENRRAPRCEAEGAGRHFGAIARHHSIDGHRVPSVGCELGIRVHKSEASAFSSDDSCCDCPLGPASVRFLVYRLDLHRIIEASEIIVPGDTFVAPSAGIVPASPVLAPADGFRTAGYVEAEVAEVLRKGANLGIVLSRDLSLVPWPSVPPEIKTEPSDCRIALGSPGTAQTAGHRSR